MVVGMCDCLGVPEKDNKAAEEDELAAREEEGYTMKKTVDRRGTAGDQRVEEVCCESVRDLCWCRRSGA